MTFSPKLISFCRIRMPSIKFSGHRLTRKVIFCSKTFFSTLKALLQYEGVIFHFRIQSKKISFVLMVCILEIQNIIWFKTHAKNDLFGSYTTMKSTTLVTLVDQSLEVSKFQNEFLKSSFLPKYERKIVRISALTTQGKNPVNFSFIFWKKR